MLSSFPLGFFYLFELWEGRDVVAFWIRQFLRLNRVGVFDDEVFEFALSFLVLFIFHAAFGIRSPVVFALRDVLLLLWLRLWLQFALWLLLLLLLLRRRSYHCENVNATCAQKKIRRANEPSASPQRLDLLPLSGHAHRMIHHLKICNNKKGTIDV